MKPEKLILNELRKMSGSLIDSGRDGMAFTIPCDDGMVRVIFSWGMGWEHASVSLESRTATWNEMCIIKAMLWHPNECCMQLHPPEEDYKNDHDFCLHIWKPKRMTIPRPPKIMV